MVLPSEEDIEANLLDEYVPKPIKMSSIRDRVYSAFKRSMRYQPGVKPDDIIRAAETVVSRIQEDKITDLRTQITRFERERGRIEKGLKLSVERARAAAFVFSDIQKALQVFEGEKEKKLFQVYYRNEKGQFVKSGDTLRAVFLERDSKTGRYLSRKKEERSREESGSNQ